MPHLVSGARYNPVMRVALSLYRAAAITVLFCTAFLFAFYGTVEGKPARRAKKRAAVAAEVCKADTDCVLVTDGCCGCNQGGKQRAVLAGARTAYEKRRKSLCKQIMCPELMSEDPSCVAGHAVCKDGSCTFGL
jgi:hypothetical protein